MSIEELKAYIHRFNNAINGKVSFSIETNSTEDESLPNSMKKIRDNY
jgi:hypothetical protein